MNRDINEDFNQKNDYVMVIRNVEDLLIAKKKKKEKKKSITFCSFYLQFYNALWCRDVNQKKVPNFFNSIFYKFSHLIVGWICYLQFTIRKLVPDIAVSLPFGEPSKKKWQIPEPG